MHIRTYPLLVLIGLCFGLPASTDAGPRKIYSEDEESTSSRSLFLRPARENAIDQLFYADELQSKGKLRKAAKAYRALIERWPREPEASVALHKRATVLRERGKLEDAFDALQQLVDVYPGTFRYDDVLQAQFDIANEVMHKRRGAFLFIPGFKAPERALDMLKQIVKNGRNWKHAPEAQYLQGSIHEQTTDYELAVLDYTETLMRYPDSPFAEQASFGRARTLVHLAERSPNDTDAAWEAWHALALFNSAFPSSQFAPEAVEFSQQIYDRLAKGAYDIAIYYDRIAKRPQAALYAYDSLVKGFPSSKWTESANQRINELNPVVEKKRAEP